MLMPVMRHHVAHVALVALVAPGLGCGLIFDWNLQPEEWTSTATSTMGTTETSEPTSGTESTQTTMTTQAETTTETTSGTTSETTGPDETSETIAEQTDTSSSTGEPMCPNGMCDPGEDNVSCPVDCEPACPNGVKETGEECDDGNEDDTDACVEGCKNAKCSDGFVLAGEEECDDGNGVDDDGCNNMCKRPRRLVFVTSASYDGNLGGLIGADLKCQALADFKMFSKTFKAWLSDGAMGPADRFDTDFEGYYVRIDDAIIAQGWKGLTEDGLMVPINLNESGVTVAKPVWSNTNPDGKVFQANVHCMNWASGVDDVDNLGPHGSSSMTGTAWTKSAEAVCSSDYRLYCFEDPV